jgi:type I restriction enzyme M protein
MRAIEEHNPDLRDVLPKTYGRLENATLTELLRLMNSIPMDIEGDAFGKIYEYFLGQFAMSEGQKGGGGRRFESFHSDQISREINGSF